MSNTRPMVTGDVKVVFVSRNVRFNQIEIKIRNKENLSCIYNPFEYYCIASDMSDFCTMTKIYRNKMP